MKEIMSRAEIINSTRALAIVDEDGQALCIACADKHAQEGGCPIQYWAASVEKFVPSNTFCTGCQSPMNNPAAMVEADRVVNFFNNPKG